LSEAEQHQLLIEWNAQTDNSQQHCVHQLFEQQVERTPDAVALVFENEMLTYAQLNRRANQLAHYLQGQGIGPDRLVGICMEHSIEMIIGLLGVLKAGGAYVPLDPMYPNERLALMAQDAHILVLLTQLGLDKQLPPSEVHVIILEEVWEKLISQPDHNPMSTVSPENLVYVIYTSGSTGIPKGVLATHANVHHLFTMTQAWFQFQTEDVWTLFHSSAFDFSVWEIWGALLYGGRLVVVPYWVSRSPDVFSRLLSDQQVTVLNQTPSAFNLLMRQEELNETLRDLALRLVIFGGEALNLESLQPWVKHHGDQRPYLINMYGITETTVHVTYRLLSQADLVHGTGSLIGRAIPNLQLYILDTHHRLVPIGVAGELYVGGLGLARGYWHQPALTAERFVPHPWSQEPGARLYRTGDLVRYHSDGDIEYLGRADQQVKVRGYRIELGEIETTLMRHPAVHEAVVLAREDIPGEKRLVAYAMREPSKMLVASELRSYLQEKLPDYMIPAFFVLLEAFPLTPNGKLDRRALPAPAKDELEAHDWVAARAPVEEIVLAIYREILGVEQISIHDNFFDRGGHSLLAIQAISRIRAVTGVELTVRSLFETPSVAGLAKQIERNIRSGQARVMPPLVPVVRGQCLPLSFAQQRLWFLDQLEPGSTAYLLSSAQRLQGYLSVEALERSFQELVDRHESLRTTFPARAGQPVQIVHPATCYCLPIIDLQEMREDERAGVARQLAEQETQCPCDLATGPLLRTYVLRLEMQEHILLVTLHHIITDGWSNGVLMYELATLYRAFITGQISPLEPLPIQYADYALWQWQWLQGEVLDSLLDYWTKQLRGATPLELPIDRPRRATVSNRGAIHLFTLPSHLWQELMTLSRQEGVTLFMTLLTAFQILLYRSTGVLDVVVGTDIAHRTSTETEKIIGFFVNLLVLRVQLHAQNTFRETLRRVCPTVLEAYAHQDLPFEKLVDALQFERKPYHIPLVNVLFVLQNAPQPVVELLGGLTVSSIDVEITTAKFDLALFLMEEAGKLTGYVNYRTDLFDPDSIARLCLHFETLLESIVTSPDIPIEMLEMLNKEEKKQKLYKEAKDQEMLLRELKIAKRHMITLPKDVF
jgi:amino acid adenylation domain-containing protein